jgi:hypothetical protein
MVVNSEFERKLKKNDRGLFSDNIPEFSWRNLMKLTNNFRIVNVMAGLRTGDFLNASPKHYSY